MCGKLPATLALFAVLGPLHPRTIKPFLLFFLSRRHSREKRYQALSRFTVLIATESWAGPGNEVTLRCCTLQSNYAPRVKHNLLKLSTLCVEIRLKNAERLKIRLKNEAPMLEAKTYSQTDIFSEVRLQRSKHGSTGIVFNP